MSRLLGHLSRRKESAALLEALAGRRSLADLISYANERLIPSEVERQLRCVEEETLAKEEEASPRSVRRRRSLRALSRRLEDELGPDSAEVVYSFADGWTIRYLPPEAYKREGEMMVHCLRKPRGFATKWWSLRDTFNIPHATFSAWTTMGSVEPLVITNPQRHIATDSVFIAAFGRANSPLKPAYLRRLREFARGCDAARSLASLPRNAEERRKILSLCKAARSMVLLPPDFQEQRMVLLKACRGQ